MRFTVAFVAGFVAMASAATTTASVDPSQASMLACLDACDATDVDCQAHCIAVPSPDKTQANNTNNCVAGCDQGDGTKSANLAYASCVEDCIRENYYVTSSGTPEQTGASNSDSKSSDSDKSDATATGTGAAPTGSDSATETDADSTATGSSTGSSASSTNSDNAAPGLVVGSVSFLGLLAAVLAL